MGTHYQSLMMALQKLFSMMSAQTFAVRRLLLYHTAPIDQLATFFWMDMVANLQQKESLVFAVLDRITSRNDHCNETRRSVEHCTPHAADGAWLNELGWSQ